MKTIRFLILLAAAALALLVSSGAADFPVVLRIVNTPNFQANVRFGRALAMADADGDGKADLLVGAAEEDVGANTDQGRAYLFDGTSGALLRTLDHPFPQLDALFGASLAMGDVDGDGLPDLLIGAPHENVGPNGNQGRAYLFSGASGALLRTLDIPVAQADALFGQSVAMGDADGDGKADILVGAPFEDVAGRADQGRAYLFSGATGALIRTLNTSVAQASAQFGSSLAMGDADGDARADTLVSAPLEDVPTQDASPTLDAGEVYLFSGASGALLLRSGILSIGQPVGRRFGSSLAMGDADGDGRVDLLVGAPFEDVSFVDQGRAYLLSGATEFLIRTLNTPNPQGNVQFGTSVAIGDVEGDGRPDFLVTAPLEDVAGTTDQGRAYLFTANGAVITLDSPNPQAFADFGLSLAMGDASGDGRADLLVGAPLENVGANGDQGRAYLFSGAIGPVLQVFNTPNPQASIFAGVLFGGSLAMGDANGDGRADLLAGAPGEDVGLNVDQGRAYLFSGASGVLLRTLNSPNPQESAAFGSPLAMGDADGDGRADLLVGAPSENVGANADQGRAYLFSGASGGLLRTLDSPNPQASAFFGRSLAMGDADGDGRADLLIGAPFENVGANTDQGRAYLFSGASGALLRTLNSSNPQALAHFGNSLAMGDRDGDGRADILVGAPNEDVSANADQGRAYLFTHPLALEQPPPSTINSPTPQANAAFGSSLAMGDAEGDGRADLLVGAPFEDVGANQNQGRAYLFSSASGGLLRTLDTPNPQAEGLFGNSLAMGDADGDGRADLLVGAPLQDVGTNDAQGRAYLFEGPSGALLQAFDTPNPQEFGPFFSQSLAMGDANGDFGADIAVGSASEDVGENTGQGRAYLFFADRDGDAWPDAQDNCVAVANSDQLDNEGDGLGNACDPDDDNDGFPDASDPCPLLAEDIDGFQDADGCPDPDNDGDGVCDRGQSSVSCTGSDFGKTAFFPAGHNHPDPAAMDCRNIAEDYDAFKDGDGCPEPDNDNDGFPDGTDQCPGTDAHTGPDGVLGPGGDFNHNGKLDASAGETSIAHDDFVETFEDYDGVLDTDGCHDSPGDDLDGDGFTDEAEALHIGTNPGKPCGADGWPADLDPNNKLDIGDLASFLFPARAMDDGHGTFNKFNHPLDDNGDGLIDPAMARWNLDIAEGAPPGGGHQPTTVINIGDIATLNPAVLAPTARPPMFGGQPAFFTNGGQCPFPP